jgi:adenylate cyclase
MASYFRSIGAKIFGVAVGLLVLMVLASLVSSSLARDVHRELRTLSHALFPLTTTLADLHGELQDTRLEVSARQRGAAGEADCRRLVAEHGAEANRLIARARSLRGRGAELAELERNKVELARLDVLISDIAAAHDRAEPLLLRLCGVSEGSALEDRLDAQAEDRADELLAKVNAVKREVAGFVTEGSEIVERNQKLSLQANLGLIGASALLGIMLAWLVARSLTRPIVRLRAGAQAVEAGRLDQEVPVTSADEIGDVTRAFNTMIAGLRAKEQIKETFGQYVDPRVVAELVEEGRAERISAGAKQTATVYFSDLAGFTSVAERLQPGAVVALMNAYFSEMSGPIRDRGGLIDKYIGDGIMAFWAPPFSDPETQAADACAAALEQFERLAAFRARVPEILGLRRDTPRIDMRIGLSTGDVVIGSIGSDIARSFTVMGDTVNFGSRLEGANKVYGTHILIDGDTRRAAGAAIETREVDRVAVMGREEPVTVHELAALGGTLSAERQALFELYAKGLEHYRKGEWASAEKLFAKALALVQGDGPSTIMLERTRAFRQTPPVDWDGAWRLTSK